MAGAAFLRLCAVLLAVCGSAQALYSSGSPVVDLNPSNFNNKIKGGGVWLVEFYAPWCGHCKALTPAWEQAAKALKGIINVGAVDADQHRSLGQEYGVQGFPTIKLMYVKDGSIKTMDYTGGRDAKSIIEYALDKAKAIALKSIGASSSGSERKASGGGSAGGSAGGDQGGFYGSGSDVINLEDGDFEESVIDSDDLWFVEFYAPWCGHCKNLKPAWEDAASTLKDKVKFGAVDCTVHQSTCSKYGVRGYPTIKFFGTDKGSPEDYQGGRDSGSLVEFGNRHWVSQQPPPEAKELVDSEAWEQHCVGEEGKAAKQVCFIAFLPNIMDTGAAGRNQYIKILQQLAEKYRERPFSYLWVEGTGQEKLEKNFGVGGYGYPALIAYVPKEQRYATCKKAFELDHLKSFVESLRRGGEPLVPLSGDLADIDTITPWDGQDAAADLEDEFDLSELMNDEL